MNLFLGGQGSGKSHCAGFVSADFMANFPNAVGLIAANTYQQLSKSTLSRVFKVWESMGIKKGVHYVVNVKPPDHFEIFEEQDKYHNTISFFNGHRIWTASLENYMSIDGMEINYALLDETKDTKEEALKEVIFGRLRRVGIWRDEYGDLYNAPGEDLKGHNPLYIFTSPAKVKWLNELFGIDEHLEEINSTIYSKETYFSKIEGDKLTVISSTYHNEENLPEGYIDKMIDRLKDVPELIDMLVYGSPIAKSGGEWYSKFDRQVHLVDGIEVDPKYPLHVSFDFNVNPYMPALLMQVIDDGATEVINVIKEYAMVDPRNNTEDVCEEIAYDCAEFARVGMFIYGDASGKNRTTTTKDNRHNYDVIKNKLANFLMPKWRRVPKSNPPIGTSRRLLMNTILGGRRNVIIRVNKKCKNLVNDFEFLKQDTNGGYKKPKKKDKNGNTYEYLGHHSDALLYFCYYNFKHLLK